MQTSTDIYTRTSGTLPLLVSMPHVGTQIPEALRGQYVDRALQVEDTDWHLERLYAFARDWGASVLQPRHSRFVIDLNRPPDNTPMYPGASNTELCPTRFFTGEALYAQGCEPDAFEQERRRITYWQPYHDALAAELSRLQAIHGQVLLWEAHSIKSHLPWLFEGKLPDLNIGTASGAAAGSAVASAVHAQATAQMPALPDCTVALNGRFKGGYITRHYGDPSKGIHAVQLEKCWSLYMHETAPYAFDEARAAQLQPRLQAMMQAALKALGSV